MTIICQETNGLCNSQNNLFTHFLSLSSLKDVYNKEAFMEEQDLKPEGRAFAILEPTLRQDGCSIYSKV